MAKLIGPNTKIEASGFIDEPADKNISVTEQASGIGNRLSAIGPVLINRIRKIFDRDYYSSLTQISDTETDLFGHFVSEGAATGLDPCLLFNAQYYRERYADAVHPNAPYPIYHYLSIGAAQGRAFHPCFDVAFYASQREVPKGADAQLDPLVDFCQYGRYQDIVPDPFFDAREATKLYPQERNAVERWLRYIREDAGSPNDPFPRPATIANFIKDFPEFASFAAVLTRLFDAAFYLKQLDEQNIRIDASEALAHYADVGWRLDLHPHPLFHTKYYLMCNPDIMQGNLNPLLHYVQHGAAEGRNYHPLLVETSAPRGAHPILLYDYLNIPPLERPAPCKFFDTKFYREKNPDIDWEIQDPLIHYITAGAFQDQQPHRLFDVRYYRQNWFVGQVAYGHSPLIDFAVRSVPKPPCFALFDPLAYLQAHADLIHSETCPVTHFMLWGNHEWRRLGGLRSEEYIYARLPQLAFNDRSAYDEYITQGLNRQKRIIFVGHEASRTGAPGILLKLIQHFGRFDDIECVSLIDQDGALIRDFERCSHVYVPQHNRIRVWTGLSTLHEFDNEVRNLLARFDDNPPVAAICNSAETRIYATVLHELGIPVVSLVHEVADFYPPEEMQDLAEASERVVLPSEFVARAMTRVCPLLPDQGRVLSQGLLRDTYGEAAKIGRERVFLDLPIGEDDFVVVGCGTIDGRKGFDLFVETARRVRDRYTGKRPIKFVWIGGGGKWRRRDGAPYDTTGYWASWALEWNKLEDMVFVIGEVKDTEPYLIHSDIFLLTSRADPFPCVIHEAMASRLPALCFANTSGAPEAIGEEGGIVVPYLDVDAMSQWVVELAEDEPRRLSMGEAGHARVRAHYAFTPYAERIGALIDEVLDQEAAFFGRVVPPAPRKGRVYFAAPAWNLSGVNTFSEELTEYLNGQGFEAEILITTGRGITGRSPGAGSVPVPSVPFRFIQPDPDLFDPTSPDHDAAYQASMRTFLTDHAPCVLIPNYDYVISALAPMLPSSVGIIGIAHADDREHYAHCYKLGPYWNEIVAVSSEIQARIVAQNPSFSNKICTIPCGVTPPDQDALSRHVAAKTADASPLKMVYAGRLEVFQKRIYDYVELARQLAAAGVPFELSLVGDGPELDNLSKMLAPFLKRGSVKLPGRLSREAVRRLMLDAHVVLVLSDFEGMPVSMIEGMQCGCIPVVYDIRSGIPDVLSNAANGFIVRKGDFAELVSVCRLLQQNALLRRKLARAALATAVKMHLTAEATGQKYVALIEKIFDAIHSRTYVRPIPLTI